MKEIGRIIEINNNMAEILIMRHTACGDCGACQVGKDRLNMVLTTENTVNGKPGDTVEIELRTENFLYASFIIYGIPLISLIIGLSGAYYGAKYMGYNDGFAQVLGAVSGLSLLTLSYFGIRLTESKIKTMSKFKPIIVRIVNNL